MPVSVTMYCGRSRIGFDLLPQLAQIDPQELRIGAFVPQLMQQEAVGEHFAGMLYQHTQ